MAFVLKLCYALGLFASAKGILRIDNVFYNILYVASVGHLRTTGHPELVAG